MGEERKITFMKAVNEAMDIAMEQDENVILIGTDVAG
ncbi:MAG: alpha-ketoacid dehydrogenase subunit beta, partial [Staphylococcus simulans]|nr:alpha-ketoacid dehydrogenase subunit beta [Staphylococcus simulans]